MDPTKILLVDDDDTFRELLSDELSSRGFAPTTAADVASAKRVIDGEDFEVGLVDLRLPDGSGLDVLLHVRKRRPDAEVIVLTGHGDIDSAIEAMRQGAFDYLRKPCPVGELEVTIQRALEKRELKVRNTILREGFAPPDMGPEFVGDSDAFWEVCQTIDRVAATDSTVLILGETGVGKDVVAKLIHARSERHQQPLVVVECAALHEALLDSELFGHEKGAFTGAQLAKHGLFEVADGGTIFLDEIGDVSLATQVKLLRVLETGTFRHVGGTKEIQVDVRILAATNRDLNDMLERGFFRQDLFFRLNTIRIEVPPLRERIEDVPLLVEHFVARMNTRFGKSRRFSPAAMDRLQGYDWPGNVREVLHVVERAIILAEGEVIGLDHLPREVEPSEGLECQDASGDLLSLGEMERRHISRVLEATSGIRSKAAGILGISERTLYRKLKDYGLG